MVKAPRRGRTPEILVHRADAALHPDPCHGLGIHPGFAARLFPSKREQVAATDIRESPARDAGPGADGTGAAN